MRLFLSIILSFLCFRCLVAAGQIRYISFEICIGYRDNGGFYGAHGTGQYITLPASDVPANWNFAHIGDETVIAGTKDQQNLSPYVSVLYVDACIVSDTSSDLNNPIVQGSPYTGGPVTSSDGSFNDLSGKIPSPAGKLVPDRVFRPGDGGSNGDGGYNESINFLNDFFVSDLVDSDGNYGGSGLYHLGESGDNYVLYDMSGNAVTRWSKSLGESCPIQYKDSNGNMQTGWYNPSTGKITSTRPNSDGTQSDFQVVVDSIDKVRQNQDLERSLLVDLLGSSGNSWVYDCKLSLSELRTLATDLGLNVSNIKSALYDGNGSLIAKLESQRREVNNIYTKINNIYTRQGQMKTSIDNVNTSLGTANTHLSDLKTSAVAINSSIGSVKSSIDTFRGSMEPVTLYLGDISDEQSSQGRKLSSIYDKLSSINDKLPDESSSLPSLPSPDLSNEPSADSLLPIQYQSFGSDAVTVFNGLTSLGSDPANTVFQKSSSFLNIFSTMLGTIPSVGSDPVMFSVSFNIPYIGPINKTFSFADWPVVLVFREVACWAMFLLFALASFNLIHRSFI